MNDFMPNPKTLFILSVWVLFLVTFLRALVEGKLSRTQSMRLWMIFFLCCIAFTLWGENSEAVLDHFFQGQQIALIVKYICLITVAHLFHALLNEVKPDHALIPLKWLSPIALIVGLAGFFLQNIYHPLSDADLRFLYIGGRDAVVMVYAVASFIPGTLSMRRDETVGIMRFKHTLIILLSLCFVITAIGSIVAAILALGKIGDPRIAASVVQPFVVLGIIFFLLIMIPHRWFAKLIHLRRFYTYYRLHCLEKQLLSNIGVASSNPIDISALFYAKELELAIYRSMISVLDFYPMLAQEERSYALYSKIQNCVETTDVYNDLVQEMTQL